MPCWPGRNESWRLKRECRHQRSLISSGDYASRLATMPRRSATRWRVGACSSSPAGWSGRTCCHDRPARGPARATHGGHPRSHCRVRRDGRGSRRPKRRPARLAVSARYVPGAEARAVVSATEVAHIRGHDSERQIICAETRPAGCQGRIDVSRRARSADGRAVTLYARPDKTGRRRRAREERQCPRP